MSVRCDDLSEVLSAYLDGEETPDEAIEVRAHLESCAECRGIVADWETIGAAVVVDEPSTLSVNTRPRRRFGGRVAILAAAAALATLGAAGSVLAAYHHGTQYKPKHGTTGGAPKTSPSAGAVQGTPSSAPKPGAASFPSTAPKQTPPPSRPGYGKGTDGQLTLWMAVPRTTVAAGDEVIADVTLVNSSAQAVTFFGPSESPIDLVVTDAAGTEVYRRSNGFGKEGTTRTMQPGDHIHETITLTLAKPGGYKMFAECSCLRRSPTPAPTSPTTKTGTQDTTPSTQETQPSKAGPFDTSPVLLTVYPRS